MLPATDRCLLLAATNAEEHAQLKENIHISSSVIHSKSICGDMKINPIIGITVSKIWNRVNIEEMTVYSITR